MCDSPETNQGVARIATEAVLNTKDTYNLLIGLSGSVATIKIKELVNELQTAFDSKKLNLNIRIVPTKNALFFATQEELLELAPTFTDEEEWKTWTKKGDPVLHIELRKWADMLLIAPLDANTMAKLAYGICDNLLTCVVRAWDFEKPMFVAPAMNTFMWDHPHTNQHLDMLKKLNFNIIDPIVKLLACGDLGVGAMATPNTITSVLIEYLQQEK